MFVTVDSTMLRIFYQSNDINEAWAFIQQRWKHVC